MTIILDGTAGIANNAIDISYTGTLTGSTGIVNIGSGQIYKDSAGNLGLGVTPSAWGTANSVKAFQIPSGSLWNFSTGYLHLGQNYYFNGTNRIYVNTAAATEYQQSLGSHQWLTAPSGTSGATITFTPSMALDSAGNLLVGTTSADPYPTQGLSIYGNNGGSSSIGMGHATGTASGNAYMTFAYNGSGIGSITQSGTTAVLYNTTSDYRLKANQQPLTGSGAFIDALKPKSWEWAADGRKDAGFIAHEFQEVCPNAVTGVKDETEEQEYEITPAVPATQDAEGVELTPAKPAVMGTRTVNKYQAMQASSAEVIANLVAELQSLRLRMAAMEAK